MEGFIRFFVERRLLANLFTIGVLIIGFIVTMTTRREAFPAVDFDVVTVMTVWRGASPEEVERLLTVPIEQDLDGIEGIKKLGSVSVENRSVIIIELDPDLSDDSKDDTIKDIRDAVALVQDLPAEADTPIVEEQTSDSFPILELNVSGPDERQVRDQVKDLEDVLTDLPEVSAIAKRGWRERQILVEVKPKDLRTYKVSLGEIAQVLGARNVNLPGGSIKTDTDEWLVRTIGEFENAKDIEPVVIRANDYGRWVQVKDVADVRDSLEELTILNRTRGQRSVDLVVIKKEGADIINTVKHVRTTVAEFQKGMPEGMHINFTDDASYYVRRRLKILVNNAIIGLIFVVISLLFFLSPRVSGWTSVGIPFSMLATLVVMQWFGVTVNLISMMGLIIVTGMLVDDAIVVAENIHRQRELGLGPVDAAARGASEVAGPVAGSILTTMAAFLPLAFMGGIFGKFIWAIPTVVCLALAASWTESMLALPAHLAHEGGLLKQIFFRGRRRKKAEDTTEGRKWFKGFANWYADKVTGTLVRFRYLVALGVMGVVVLAVVLASNMKIKLFSSEGIEIFFVRVQASAGTPLEQTEAMFKPIEGMINALPDQELDTFTSQIGVWRDNPGDPFTRRASHYAQAKVYLRPEAERDRTAAQIIESLRKQIGDDTEWTQILFTRVHPGPPVGKPVSITLKGEDWTELKGAEGMVMGELEKLKLPKLTFFEKIQKKRLEKSGQPLPTYPEAQAVVKDIESDLEVGKKELFVRPDEAAAREAGISTADIALAVRASFDGALATTIRTLDEEVDVLVRFPEADRRRGVAAIKDVRIPNRLGYLIPLTSVAKIEEGVGWASIKHDGGKRAVTVSGDIYEDRATSVEVNQAIAPIIQKRLSEEFPHVQADFSGEFADTQESFGRLFKAFGVAAFLIFIILATVFNSLTRPFLVMLAIPIAACGVIFAFFLHGQPLGFMTMMGTIGMAGVVVNNSIVFVQFFNRLQREDGMLVRDALVETARLRLRPMLLTSLTTLVGLMPVAYGLGGSDPFVKPMALALSWGVAFSLLMTLLALPAMIHILTDIEYRGLRLLIGPQAAEYLGIRTVEPPREPGEKDEEVAA